jgi:hypothetical protein
MPRLVILVHGMGVHPAGWSKGVQDKLDEVSQEFAFFANKPLASQVEYAEVGYDDIFVKELAGSALTAQALEGYAKSKKVDVSDMVSWLGQASESEKNFFWSHCVDVLLFRFVRVVRKAVLARVRNQIGTAIAAAQQKGPTEVTIVAHSLGTSVTHDALATLGAKPWNNSNAFLAGTFQVQSLFMIANVSRCLETDDLTSTSCVFPGTLKKSAYTQMYFNVRHKLDPIPAVRPLEPANWSAARYEQIEALDHLRDLNVHNFEHYLDHPDVHIPLFRRLFGGSAVTPEEELVVLKQYPLKPAPRCPERVAALRERYRQMVTLLQGNQDPAALIKASAQFFAAAQEAKNACT